eukprot:c25307_g2_i1 orf=2-445(-)
MYPAPFEEVLLFATSLYQIKKSSAVQYLVCTSRISLLIDVYGILPFLPGPSWIVLLQRNFTRGGLYPPYIHSSFHACSCRQKSGRVCDTKTVRMREILSLMKLCKDRLTFLFQGSPDLEGSLKNSFHKIWKSLQRTASIRSGGLCSFQ